MWQNSIARKQGDQGEGREVRAAHETRQEGSLEMP
jgi:hypothetical protein